MEADGELMELCLASRPSNLRIDPVLAAALTALFAAVRMLDEEEDLSVRFLEGEVRTAGAGALEFILTESKVRERMTARASVAVAEGGREAEVFLLFPDLGRHFTWKRLKDGTESIANYDARKATQLRVA